MHRPGDLFDPQSPCKSGRSGSPPQSNPPHNTHSQRDEFRNAHTDTRINKSLKLKMLYEMKVILMVKAE